MIKSMTGYGRAQGSFSGGDITVEVKSVNNRYLDCGVKLPRGYAYLEESIKALVQKSISRGKVDVFVTINAAGASSFMNCDLTTEAGIFCFRTRTVEASLSSTLRIRFLISSSIFWCIGYS